MARKNPIARGRKKTSGMSQQELADAMNVSRQTVSKWENKQATPNVHTIIELARRLDLTLDELVLYYKEEKE